MNSPVSQKLPVASMVSTYTVQAIRQTIQPTTLFILLKVILYGVFKTSQTYRKNGNGQRGVGVKGSLNYEWFPTGGYSVSRKGAKEAQRRGIIIKKSYKQIV